MSQFWRIFDRTVDGMAAGAALVLLLVNLAVCGNVVLRALGGRSLIWVFPAAEYGLLWVVFLATTWLLREQGHVSVDLVVSHLPEAARRKIAVAVWFLAAAACGLTFWLCALHTADCLAHQVTDVRAVTVPKAAVFVVIPVGFFFLTLQCSRLAWARARAPHRASRS